MKIAEQIACMAYGKSAAPEALENKTNGAFLAGYYVGCDPMQADHGKYRIRLESAKRGHPELNTPEGTDLKEWTRGYFAGLFARLLFDVQTVTGVKIS